MRALAFPSLLALLAVCAGGCGKDKQARAKPLSPGDAAVLTRAAPIATSPDTLSAWVAAGPEERARQEAEGKVFMAPKGTRVQVGHMRGQETRVRIDSPGPLYGKQGWTTERSLAKHRAR